VYSETHESIDVVALGIAVMDNRGADLWIKRCLTGTIPSIDDITSHGRRRCEPGGGLLHGWAALRTLCCRIRDDALGRMFLSEIAARGVDVSRVAVSGESVTSAAMR
jgi:sugar/nucleoside kinase (ribokinase family)